MNDGSSKRWSTSRPQPTSVSFEKPHWRTVLTTKDKAKALAMAKEKVRVQEVTPKPKRGAKRSA